MCENFERGIVRKVEQVTGPKMHVILHMSEALPWSCTANLTWITTE